MVRPWIFALMLLFVTACSGPLVAPLRYAPDPPAPEESFRAVMPDARPELPNVKLEWGTTTLPNGVRVAVLERRSSPLVSVRLIFERGLSDLGAPLNVGSILARMLANGSASRTEEELSQAYARIGAQRGLGIGHDTCWIWGKAESSDMGALVGLIAESARKPRFTPRDFNDMRARWAADFASAQGDSDLILDRSIAALLWGAEHPYGFRQPDPTHTKELDVAMIKLAHSYLFHPALATLVVVGDVTLSQVTDVAARELGGWTSPVGALVRAKIPMPSAPSVSVVFIHGWGRAQSRIVARGPAPNDADAPAIAVLVQLLGGISSSLYEEVRVVGGAAYSFYGGVDWNRSGSTIHISSALDENKAIAALRSMLAAVAEARDRGVSEVDMERAKMALIGEWRARIGTGDGLAWLVHNAIDAAAPLASIVGYPKRIQAVTRADVQRAAQRWLHAGALRLVVAGNERLRDDLVTLGLGPVRTHQASKDLPR